VVNQPVTRQKVEAQKNLQHYDKPTNQRRSLEHELTWKGLFPECEFRQNQVLDSGVETPELRIAIQQRRRSRLLASGWRTGVECAPLGSVLAFPV